MDVILKFLLLFLFCWVTLVVSVVCVYVFYSLLTLLLRTSVGEASVDTPGNSFRQTAQARV
nr:P6 protein [Carrot closterovirus 2]